MVLLCVYWRWTRASALIVWIHSARGILHKLLENCVLNYFGYPYRQQRLFLVRGTNFCRTNGRYLYISYIKMTLIHWSVVGISRRNVGRYYLLRCQPRGLCRHCRVATPCHVASSLPGGAEQLYLHRCCYL